PGLVGMLASAGALDQVGAFCARVSGDVADDVVFSRALQFLRAAVATNRLRGETYGLIGGRSMGMYTAQSPLDQWRRQFGIDVEQAVCNDANDWEGPDDPIVCATEADMDGALTMELFKHVAGTPVLFADVRHYDAADNVWDLCNSGQHATYFAGRSFDPKVNLPKVRFYPEIIYFPAGGASVAHIAAPGPVTLARLARRQGRYWMAIVPAEFVEFRDAVAWKKAEATTLEWPHAFTRFQVTPEVFLASYDSNHIHGVYGDYVQELLWICRILGLDSHVFA